MGLIWLNAIWIILTVFRTVRKWPLACQFSPKGRVITGPSEQFTSRISEKPPVIPWRTGSCWNFIHMICFRRLRVMLFLDPKRMPSYKQWTYHFSPPQNTSEYQNTVFVIETIMFVYFYSRLLVLLFTPQYVSHWPSQKSHLGYKLTETLLMHPRSSWLFLLNLSICLNHPTAPLHWFRLSVGLATLFVSLSPGGRAANTQNLPANSLFLRYYNKQWKKSLTVKFKGVVMELPTDRGRRKNPRLTFIVRDAENRSTMRRTSSYGTISWRPISS